MCDILSQRKTYFLRPRAALYWRERERERERESERERERERGYTQQMPILENAYNKNFGSWKGYKYNKTCKLVSFP